MQVQPLGFTAAEHSRTCCLGVNKVQARSERLGPGLTASAPHHKPRGLLHPRVRKRLDFGCADNIFVPSFPFDFKVVQGACGSARAARIWLACHTTRAHSRACPLQAWFKPSWTSWT